MPKGVTGEPYPGKRGGESAGLPKQHHDARPPLRVGGQP